MAKLKLVAAIGKNNELGKDNHLIWHLKGDLKFFKEQTINHKIVMGYHTFQSLPGLLPKREHIVLTHKNIEIDGVQTFHTFQDLTCYLSTLDEDAYIIGGASIYKLFMNMVDELILTEIDAEYPEADVYFPVFDKNDCKQEMIKECEENHIKYKHIRYIKRPNLMLSSDYTDTKKLEIDEITTSNNIHSEDTFTNTETFADELLDTKLLSMSEANLELDTDAKKKILVK